MMADKWLELVNNAYLLPPAHKREEEQHELSAAFAVTVKSVEGSFKKVGLSLLHLRISWLFDVNAIRVAHHVARSLSTVSLILWSVFTCSFCLAFGASILLPYVLQLHCKCNNFREFSYRMSCKCFRQVSTSSGLLDH
jgi:hypothetical protein